MFIEKSRGPNTIVFIRGDPTTLNKGDVVVPVLRSTVLQHGNGPQSHYIADNKVRVF